jgi:hypothetical protein
MDLFQMKDAVSHIKASDEFKQKTTRLLADRLSDDSREPHNHAVSTGHRHLVRSLALASAIVIAVLAGIFTLTKMPSFQASEKNTLTVAATTDNTLTGSVTESTGSAPAAFDGQSEMMALGVSPKTTSGAESETDSALLNSAASPVGETAVSRIMAGFTDTNSALLEVNGFVYYMKDDGRLLLYQSPDVSTALTTVPVEPGECVFSDGTYFYYSLDNVIYQFSADGSAPKDIWKADTAISLQYIDADHMIFKYISSVDLSDSYVIVDRTSGQSRSLLKNIEALASANGVALPSDGSDDLTVSLLSASDDSAVLDISGRIWNSLCTVSLASLELSQIFDSPAIGACEIGSSVYFVPVPADSMDANVGTDSGASGLYCVQSDGKNLSQVDLSAISFDYISGISKSGEDLLLSVHSSDTDNSVYLYQPLSSDLTLQKDGLGNISNFFSTDHYYTLYSQDLSGSGTDKSLIEKIIR